MTPPYPLSAFFGVSRVLPETIENNRSTSLAFIAFSFSFYFIYFYLQPQTNITRNFTESWKMVRVLIPEFSHQIGAAAIEALLIKYS